MMDGDDDNLWWRGGGGEKNEALVELELVFKH
jgi:hypothetical protein